MEEIRRELRSLSDYSFQRTRRRLEGLSDEEYLWEPVGACWSARPRSDGRWRLDYALSPLTVPFTTLAWRLWHLVACYGQTKNGQWLEVSLDTGGRFEMHAEVPATASGAVQCLDEAHGHWQALLDAVSEEGLERPIGAIAGPYAEQKKVGYVLHMIDEFVHHGAELGMLRDLYRSVTAQGQNPPVVALLAGDRAALPPSTAIDTVRASHPDLLVQAIRNGYGRSVPLLFELGFTAADLPDDAIGATPLHYAAGAGDLDLVRLLVDRGADPSRRDRRYGADAVGWAEYYGREEVVEFLASR